MHGTGAFNAMWNLVLAGSVVTTEGRHFDAVELLDAIEQRKNTLERVTRAIVARQKKFLDLGPGRQLESNLLVLEIRPDPDHALLRCFPRREPDFGR